MTTTRLFTIESDILVTASRNAFVFARLTSSSAAVCTGRLNAMQFMFILIGDIFSICSRRPISGGCRGRARPDAPTPRQEMKYQGTAELLVHTMGGRFVTHVRRKTQSRQEMLYSNGYSTLNLNSKS